MQLTITIYQADSQGRPTGAALTGYMGRDARQQAEQYIREHGGRMVAVSSQQ